MVAKFSTPPMFMLAVGSVLVLKPEGIAISPKAWNWGKGSSAILIASLVVWGTYFFHISQVTLREGHITIVSPARTKPPTENVRAPKSFTFYIPAGEYLKGLWSQVKHARNGHPSFFLGTVSASGGWKTYFPAVILLKWPIVVLLIMTTTVILALVRQLSLPRDLLLMVSFPALYFLFAVFTKVNIGERHILPLYPFVLLLGAGLWEVAKSHRVTLALIVMAMVIQVADCLRYAPDYLSYFSPFVKPQDSYKLLTDSNLDWGQGLLALRKYEAEYPNEKIYLAYFGRVHPSVYGLRSLPLKETERVSGIVVISATHLSGQLLHNPNSYRWVLQFSRKAVLNHTLHVFDTSGEATQHW